MLELIKTVPKGTSGIYKITSPSKKVYIGKAVCIRKRWHQYNLKECTKQPRLFASFKKHGVQNHIFEIIEICSEDDLSSRENYWQVHYDVIGRYGLNCVIEDPKSGKRVLSEYSRAKASTRMSGENHPNYGKKLSQETRDKIGAANRGRKYTGKILDEMRSRLKEVANRQKGKTRSDDIKNKIKHTKSLTPRYNAKLILHKETGIFYDSLSEAFKYSNQSKHTYQYIKNKSNGTSKLKIIIC
jgi:group I intron endonuclease